MYAEAIGLIPVEVAPVEFDIKTFYGVQGSHLRKGREGTDISSHKHTACSKYSLILRKLTDRLASTRSESSFAASISGPEREEDKRNRGKVSGASKRAQNLDSVVPESTTRVCRYKARVREHEIQTRERISH